MKKGTFKIYEFCKGEQLILEDKISWDKIFEWARSRRSLFGIYIERNYTNEIWRLDYFIKVYEDTVYSNIWK